MKKIIVSKILFCILFTVSVTAGSVSAGNRDKYDKKGLYVTSINRILRLEDDEIDLATVVLLASRDWDNYTNYRKYRSKIDDMADEIWQLANQKAGRADNISLIKTMNQYLFVKQGYKAVDNADDYRDLFLHSVIDEKQGYCLSLSMLYLSIGQRLGLPLYGVVVPGHFFVRYDDGRIVFNIETTSNGNIATDQHYREKFKVPNNRYDNLYMKNLTNKQAIGCFFNNLGNSYQTQGDIDKAQKIFKKAVELAPTLTESLNNLGNIYLGKKNFSKAMIYFRKALRINPDDANVHLNIGNVYLSKNMPAKAIVQLKKAIAYNPKLSQAYLSLAKAYRQKKLYNTALDTISKAFDTNSEAGPEYLREIALIYQAMGSYGIAEDYFNRALKEKDCWAEVYFEMGLLYDDADDTDEEKQAYLNALECDSKMVGAMQNLGNVYIKEENYDRAIELFTAAVEIDPENSALYFGLGLANAQMKNYEYAEKFYKKTIKLNRKDKSAYYNLAVCYYNMKKYKQAYTNAITAEELGFELPEGLIDDLKKRIH